MKRAFAAGAQAGESVERAQGPPRSRSQRDSRRGRRELPGDGRASAPTSCRPSARILTHCNAGALATAGYGTALGVIRARRRSRASVVAGVRRRDAAVPAGRAADRVGAGARRHRHDRHHRQHGRRRSCGRATSTWSSSAPTASPPTATSRTRSAPTRVAVLAHAHGIPFYVAAPLSTIDLRHARRRPDSDRGAQRARGDAPRAQRG